jgi:3-methyladenine DNA glycosylase Tag
MPEAPQQINPTKLADYLEIMTKVVFQSGMSWKVVEAKWPGFREAFRVFDPRSLAELSPDEIDQLGEDTRIIRNRRKIQATVENARTMLNLDAEHGGFRNYLRAHGGFEGTLANIRKQFKFMGEFGTYYFLYVVGEQVPPYEEFCSRQSPANNPAMFAKRK